MRAIPLVNIQQVTFEGGIFAIQFKDVVYFVMLVHPFPKRCLIFTFILRITSNNNKKKKKKENSNHCHTHCYLFFCVGVGVCKTEMVMKCSGVVSDS